MSPLDIDFKILSDVRDFAAPLRKTFDDIVVVGLGGSALGTEALCAALGPFRKGIFFLDNLDPSLFHRTVRRLRFSRTLFLLISKSGETLETLMLAKALFKLCRQKKLSLQKHFVVITEIQNSQLFRIKEREKLPFFPHPKNIPGRYSVFSPVTLVPAELMGVDIKKFLSGTSQYSKYDLKSLTAFAVEMYKKNKKNMVLFHYSERLGAFCQWASQLIAESLGKQREGITPLLALGPKDQHSLLQLFLDGPSDKWYLFVSHDPRDDEKIFTPIIEKEKIGVMKTFKEKKKPFLKLHVAELNETTLGALFYTLMKFTISMGDYLEVNPFNQPAVERSKQITRQLLA